MSLTGVAVNFRHRTPLTFFQINFSTLKTLFQPLLTVANQKRVGFFYESRQEKEGAHVKLS